MLAANSGAHGQARALLRAALRPRRASATRPPRRRCATRSSPTSRTSSRSTTTASCATSSALIDATLRTNAYKDGRGATAFKLRSADVPAIPQPAPLFEIYVYSRRDGGHPPARRPDRPRRDPLVGPDGLPHRGLRPDAGAADQERDHRPGRRQGRLHRQARAGRPRGAARPRSSAST